VFGVLDVLDDAVAKVAASEQSLDVVRLREIANRVEALWFRAIVEGERRGDWQAEGYVSAASWVRHRHRLTHGAAIDALACARTLDAMPALSHAFEAGEVSRQHVSVVARCRTAETAEQFARLDEAITVLATHLDPRALRNRLQHFCDALVGDDGGDRDERQHAQRSVYLSETIDGMGVLDGRLDPEGCTIVATTLKAYMDRDLQAGDTRTSAQRRADALVQVCTIAAAQLPDDPDCRYPAHFSINVDLQMLEGRAPESFLTNLRGEAADGPLSVATLRRLACDARISRVITDGASEPLDVGRLTRTHTAAQWRALVARDGGCVDPGCDRGPQWCRVHHKDHWIDDGPTDIDNLELRCGPHHRDAHRQDLQRRRRNRSP
jgi:hypothetical protein